MLTVIAKAESEQGRLFVAAAPEADAPLAAVDAVNRRFGVRAAYGAMGMVKRLQAAGDARGAEGERPAWGMRRGAQEPPLHPAPGRAR